MLEPCDAKVSRTVLRGLGDRKVARLLGKLSRTVLRGLDGSDPVRLLGHPPTIVASAATWWGATISLCPHFSGDRQ